MEEMKCIKEKIVSIVYDKVDDLESMPTKELGEVIDMIKDMAEAVYYCTVTKAMESEGGCSSESRKNYMTAKHSGLEKSILLKDLEEYLNDLQDDLTEVSKDISAEEKTMIQTKLQNILNGMK